MTTAADCARLHVAWFERRAGVLGHEDWTDDGHRWIRTGDHVFLLFPECADVEVVARGLARAAELGARMVGAWLLDDADPAGLRDNGFDEGWQPWWMAAEVDEMRLVDDPRVELQQVARDGDYTGEHAAYAHELALTRLEPQLTWYAAAYEDGRFAGRAWSTLDGTTAGVFDVATWPAFRRRGLGAATTSAVVRAAAAAGAREVVLNATPEGSHLYAALGMRRIGEGRTWWKRVGRGLGAGEPSRTAYGAATHRAVHQDLEGGRVFRDPLAWQILGGDHDAILARARERDRSTLRLFIALRHRFAEDGLAAAVARGVDQAVVLGAGLDTFAYRNPHPGLRVLEVDHPATAQWKQRRLERAGITVPEGVGFVGVDFERDDLLERLRSGGLDTTRPTYFLWLGVVPYLTEEAVMSTLTAIAAIPGAEVVFDYPSADVGEGEARALREGLERRVAALGEPILSHFDADDLETLLRQIGFDEVEDVGAAELGPRYLGLARSVVRRRGGGHVVRARRTS